MRPNLNDIRIPLWMARIVEASLEKSGKWSPGQDAGFRCPSCGAAVRPARTGDASHFEHAATPPERCTNDDAFTRWARGSEVLRGLMQGIDWEHAVRSALQSIFPRRGDEPDAAAVMARLRRRPTPGLSSIALAEPDDPEDDDRYAMVGAGSSRDRFRSSALR